MTQSFLTFDIGSATLAVPSELVLEVFEAACVVRLPFTAPWVEGLANLTGRIMPQVDLFRHPDLGIERADPRPFLLVVRAGSGLVSLRVGRLGGTVAAAAITVVEAVDETHPTLVAARFVLDDRDVRVIDPTRIALGVDLPALPGIEAVALTGTAPVNHGMDHGRTAGRLVRLLLVETGGRPVALRMDGLLWIFPLGEVRPLPSAPPMVRGVATVRNRAILLVDLDGNPTDGAPPQGYGCVFATAGGPVALRVDAVRGVVRVDALRQIACERSAVTAREEEVVDHDGQLVDLRSGSRMLSDDLDSLVRFIPDGRDAGLGAMQPRPTRRFLTLLIGGQTYALDFSRIQRVSEYAGRERLPGGTGDFDGIADVDGSILPLIDLRRVLAGRAGDGGILILVSMHGGTVALIADDLSRIRKVAEDTVDTVADALTEAVIRLEDRIIPVLRPDGLMAAGRGRIPPPAPVPAFVASVP